jgi:predicted GNAT family acetyltransferase
MLVPMATIETRDNAAASRYEAYVDGELAGFAEYTLSIGTITFTHTEVMDAFEGQGIGSALARFAIDDVRAEGGRRVKPVCPFFAEWISRHPDYQDLVVR